MHLDFLIQMSQERLLITWIKMVQKVRQPPQTQQLQEFLWQSVLVLQEED
jgi:hypothetical protein